MPMRVMRQTVYDRLWLSFHKDFFRFEDAVSMIYPETKKFTQKQLKYVSKLLNEIEDNGYAIHKKADYDQRVYLYRLLAPEKVTESWAIYSFLGKQAFIDKIAEYANEHAKWNYMSIKDSAVGFWTNYYRDVNIFHFSVSEDDLDGWISLFKLFDYSTIVDGVVFHETKSKAQSVHFHSDLKERAGTEEMVDHVQPLHYTVAEGFADSDVLGALAVLLRNRKKIEWNKVIIAASEYHAVNAMGFSLEALNREARKEVFDSAVIKQIHKNIEKRISIIGSKDEKSVRIGYEDLEKKWNVKCFLYSAFEKAVLDMV